MKFKKESFIRDRSRFLEKISLVILIILISFFPQPLLVKYQLYIRTFLVFSFLIIFSQKRVSMFRRNDYPLWIFLIAISVNIFFAKNRGIALKTYLDLSIPMCVIYYLTSDSFSCEDKFSLFVKIVSLFSVAVSLGAILEVLLAFNPLYERFIENPFYERYITGFVRPMSTQFNPAALGGYLLGCLPFNYFLFKRDASFFKLLGAVGIVLNTVTIILTFSRSAFLGLIVMAAFYLLAQKSYRFLAILSIIVSIVMLSCSYSVYPFTRFGINRIIKNRLLPVSGKHRPATASYDIKTRHRADGALTPYRLKRLNMMLCIMQDHPFVGLGFQHFRSRFQEYYPGKYKRVPYEKRIADNMHLTILAETGIIGFFGFLIFIVSFLWKGWRRLKTLDGSSYERWGLLVTLMAFIGLLIDMAGYEFFYWPNQYMFFCIIAGLLGGFLRDGRKKLTLQ